MSTRCGRTYDPRCPWCIDCINRGRCESEADISCLTVLMFAAVAVAAVVYTMLEMLR